MLDQKRVNLWVAKIIPLILIAIVSYASWAIVAEVAIHYLINPPTTSPQRPRPGAATAILAVYFFLLVLVASTYFRTLYAIVANPGYVPRGSKHHKKYKHEGSRKSKSKGHNFNSSGNGDVEKVAGVSGYPSGYTYAGSDAHGPSNPSITRTGLEEFYEKDIFECGNDGMPRWCSTCMIWKPDRAHHCREVGRCVRKMDHYCPWVGGIVSETNFKFFVQFTTSAAVYCAFILIIVAVIIAEIEREGQNLNVHYIIVLSGIFFVFAAGMAGSSLDLIFRNSTSIENLSKARVWTLAVHLPNPQEVGPQSKFQTVTFQGTSFSSPPRTFAIIHSKLGESPYDLGRLDNFKSVMGNRWIDWLLPLRPSPCCDHSGESAFALGPAVQRMKEEAGLVPPVERRRRRRKSKGKRLRETLPRGDDTATSDDRSVEADEEGLEG